MNKIQLLVIKSRISDLEIEIKDRIGRIKNKHSEIDDCNARIDSFADEIISMQQELNELKK